MPEIQVPFIGSVSIVVLALPLLYGPLAIWIILRLAGILGRPREESRLRRRPERTLLFWACPECHSVTPEPADVCYYCGARRLTSDQPEVPSAAPAVVSAAPAAGTTATTPAPSAATRAAPTGRTAHRAERASRARRQRASAADTPAEGAAQRPSTVPVLRVVTPEAESADAIAAAADIVADARSQGAVRSRQGQRAPVEDRLDVTEADEPARPGRRVAG